MHIKELDSMTELNQLFLKLRAISLLTNLGCLSSKKLVTRLRTNGFNQNNENNNFLMEKDFEPESGYKPLAQ